MNRRAWLLGVLSGLTTGLLVAAVMTVLDWIDNPAGIFHDESGTDWSIVGETALSWFCPLALAALLLTVAAHSVLMLLRSRR